MFYGREKELLQLNKLYLSGKFEFAVIYGRRRVGKTAIISEFIKDKKCIFFTGVESNKKQNLENLSASILDLAIGISAKTSFMDFQGAIEYAFELAKEERIVFVIDEYPYVAKTDKSLASTLQLLIDKYKDKSKLFLILCGSSMSYMQDKVLAYKAPLYGRRTAQFKIEPFGFFEAIHCLKNFSKEDKAVAYGVMGGTPQYLLQINDELSIEENIKSIFLNPNSAIFEEPVNLVKQEVREPAIYNATISAIANGASKMSEISSKVGEDTSICSSYIKNLISLGILKKEAPFGEKSSKKAIYAIEDNMFRFWYRFVPGNASAIMRGAKDFVYEKIESEISGYMGHIFEEICKEYLWNMLISGESPIAFDDMGRWWGTNHKTRKQEEIDIIAANKTEAIFCECKWKNEKIDLGVIEKLIEKSNLFSFKNKYFYIFAKNGFTKSCTEFAKTMGNLKLVRYEDM